MHITTACYNKQINHRRLQLADISPETEVADGSEMRAKSCVHGACSAQESRPATHQQQSAAAAGQQ
jgi:hypothetical protein